MLKFFTASNAILTHKSDCLLLFVKNEKPARWGETVCRADKLMGGALLRAAKQGDFSGKAGKVVVLRPAGFACARVVVAGIGAGGFEDAQSGIDAAFAALAGLPAKTAAAAADNLSPDMLDYAVVEAGRACYKFNAGGALPGAGSPLGKISVLPPRGYSSARLARVAATAEGAQLTRHLAEQPGNVCTPAFLANVAGALAKKTTLRATVWDEKQIKKRGMTALLAVAAGSAQPPRFVVLRHNGGAKNAAPVALVGKGVTFDTGGISLKPAAAMDEMKFDMCGAATVFGVMLACARAKLPLNVAGIVPACENMPGGRAVKPGDVIGSYAGKSIEVLNTDAEGRLILADALAYADTLKPAAVVDMATLTGACVIALGNHVSGLMGRGEGLLQELQEAGEAAGDPCWRLPLGKKYDEQLKSDYADVANIGGRAGGTITAACFLARFAQCKNWAHLDIAGTAWSAKKRATARPLPLLMRFLRARAGRV